MKKSLVKATLILAVLFGSCKKSSDSSPQGRNPDVAATASVDRFTADAGHLQVRTSSNGLPGPNQPVNLDQDPFITQGFGPGGQVVQYYNLDVQSSTPAPIYVLFREGSSSSVDGQLNIINLLPGEAGYTDFWQIQKVSVPANYVANSITSLDEIEAKGYTITSTTDLVNCPVVPKGSTASKTFGSSAAQSLARGWYKDQVVYYFSFSESPISTNADGKVPTLPIYVTFNVNPDSTGGGPASGFKTEPNSSQTHNVISALPKIGGYTPLWIIDIYDNAYFDSVKDWPTAGAAPLKVSAASLVNCPVVTVQAK
jgi:hypothetical protein